MQTSKLVAVGALVLAVGWIGGASAQSGRKYFQSRTAASTLAKYSEPRW